MAIFVKCWFLQHDPNEDIHFIDIAIQFRTGHFMEKGRFFCSFGASRLLAQLPQPLPVFNRKFCGKMLPGKHGQFFWQILNPLTHQITNAKNKSKGIHKMSLKEIIDIQRQGLRESPVNGVIGLHLASGPIVGFAIGYGLDAWLNTGPCFKFVFFIIGIMAGFLNVWRDSRILVKKLEKENNSS